MTLYHLSCPKCDKELDFDYSEFSSFSKFSLIFRNGAHSSSIKYSSCRKRERYNDSDKDRIE